MKNIESSKNNYNEEEIITKKTKTIKRSTRVKNTNNPTSIKQSYWKGDSFDEGNDDELKKNKALNRIKNAHVLRIKNNVLLKEINNAHDEVERLNEEGDYGSAKMMETELNSLHGTVILSNIYPITKPNLGKTAYYSNPYGSFAQSKMSINNKNLNRTMKTKNKQFYEENIEEVYEENEENEEETQKRKNKRNKKGNKNPKNNNFNKNMDNLNNQIDGNENDGYDDDNQNNNANNVKNNPNSDNDNAFQPNNDNNNLNNPNPNRGNNNLNNSNLGNNNNLNSPNIGNNNNNDINKENINNNNNPNIDQLKDNLDNNKNNNLRNLPNSNKDGENDPHKSTSINKNIIGRDNQLIIVNQNDKYINNANENVDENEFIRNRKRTKKKKNKNKNEDYEPEDKSIHDNDFEENSDSENIEENEESENEPDNNKQRMGGITISQEMEENMIYQDNNGAINPNFPNQYFPNNPPPNVYQFPPQQNQGSPNIYPNNPTNQPQQPNQFPNHIQNPKIFNANPNNPQKPNLQNPNNYGPITQYPNQLYPNQPYPNINPKTGKPYLPQNPNINPNPNIPQYLQYPAFQTNPRSPNSPNFPNKQYPYIISQYPPNPKKRSPNNPKEQRFKSPPSNPIVRIDYVPYPSDPNIYNTTYPLRPIIHFGEPLDRINKRFRSKPKVKRKSPATILYGKGSKGSCFACDVNCGISISGNSPNNYNPYLASQKYPRFDVTFYEGKYYQHRSELYQ